MSGALPDHANAFALPEWGDEPAGTAGAVWREGYLWMRLARYDLAFDCWARVGDELAPQVAVSQAAALRELGLHEAADQFDLDAAGAAVTPTVEAAALIGLAADAVGVVDLPLARARVGAAAAAVASLRPGHAARRQRIRLGWVHAEVALLANERPHVDLPHLARDGLVVPGDYDSGSQHHVAKGLLFAGVIDRDLAELERAAALAPPCLAWAVHLARRDLGAPGAAEAAREAWGHVVPPPEHAAAVRDVQTWA